MCTFNIALDDKLVDTAKASFLNVDEMTAWMEDQITVLLRNHAISTERAKIDSAELNHRKAHKHDALMGIIYSDTEKDYKRIHLREKYGV